MRHRGQFSPLVVPANGSWFTMARRRAILAGVLCGCAGPVWAQPQAPTTQWNPQAGAKVAAAWDTLREGMAESEFEQPEEAIKAYRQFYQDEGYRDPATSIRITSLIAQLYVQALNNRDKAIEMYDWAIPLYGSFPEGKRLSDELGRLTGDNQTPATSAKAVTIRSAVRAPVTLKEAAIAKDVPANVQSKPAAVQLQAGVPGAAEVIVEAGRDGLRSVNIGSVLAAPSKMPGGATVTATPDAGKGAVSLTPIRLGKPAANAAVPDAAAFNPMLFKLPLFIKQMNEGKVSGKDLFENKTLSVDEIYFALNSMVVLAEAKAEVRNDLVDLLVKHGADRLQNVEGLPDHFKFLLGDYYAARKDPRAIEAYEAVTKPIAKHALSGDIAADGLDRLSTYYRVTGQTLKAAETQLRIADFTQDPSWLSLSLLTAARLFTEGGNTAKADELYGKVAQHGYAYGTGVMLIDRAKVLMDAGRHKEARDLLQTQVVGLYAEQVKVGQLHMLGRSYYMTGDVENARKYCQQTVDAAAAIEILPNEGIEYVVDFCKEMLKWLDVWKQSPVVSDPPELSIAGQYGKENAARRIKLRTFKPAAFKVVNAGGIVAHLSGKNVDRFYYNEQDLEIEIPPTAFKADTEVAVIVQASDAPDMRISIPVKVQLQKPVVLSRESVFFGLVKSGENATKNITLTSSLPFKITGLEFDASRIRVDRKAVRDGLEYVLQLDLLPLKPGDSVEGVVTVKTDLPGQEVIRVPYMGQAKTD